MGSQKVYYQGRDSVVTASHFKTKRKGYRLGDITRIDVRRAHFFMLLPLLLGILSLILFCSELLYWHEIFFGLGFVVVIGGAAWSVVALHVYGFNINGMATVGLFHEIDDLKNALDQAIENSYQHSGTRRL